MNSLIGTLSLIAQTGADAESTPPWLVLTFGLLPWIAIVVLIWLVFHKLALPLIRRTYEHMDRLEAKSDKTVDLLERICDKLDPPVS